MTVRPTFPLLRHRAGQRGAAMIEYLVVVGVLLIVLLSSDSIPTLVTKLREAYTSFVYALSLSWM